MSVIFSRFKYTNRFTSRCHVLSVCNCCNQHNQLKILTLLTRCGIAFGCNPKTQPDRISFKAISIKTISNLPNQKSPNAAQYVPTLASLAIRHNSFRHPLHTSRCQLGLPTSLAANLSQFRTKFTGTKGRGLAAELTKYLTRELAGPHVELEFQICEHLKLRVWCEVCSSQKSKTCWPANRSARPSSSGSIGKGKFETKMGKKAKTTLH